jgi:hypothetical protein
MSRSNLIRKRTKKILTNKGDKMRTLIFASVLLIPIYLFTGCNDDDNHMDEDHMEGTEQMENQEMNSPGNVSIDSSIIRDKNVDIASIDQNGDGKVYQCPMHLQVISDDAGNCPICKMNIKQYSVAEAQKNLETKHK